MVLRDVLTGERHDVREGTASRSLQPHAVVFAQLASAEGINLIEAVAEVVFSPDDKVEIIELRQRMREGQPESDRGGPYVGREQLREWEFELRELYWTLSERALCPTLPELRATDGKELEFHKLVFDIDSAQIAFDALRHLDPDADDPETMEGGLHRDANGVLQRARIHWAKTRDKVGAGPRTLLGAIARSWKLRWAEPVVAASHPCSHPCRMSASTQTSSAGTNVTLGELRRGVELIRHRGDTAQATRLEAWLESILGQYDECVLDVDADVAQLWGRLRVPHPENSLDKQIAATALLHDLTVVTRNHKHFEATGLKVVNPFST
jgi:predicted nucleic acid-binding protein